MEKYKAVANILIGGLGFQFVKKFGAAGWFTNKVTKLLNNGKRECKFNDRDIRKYLIEQIKTYASKHRPPDRESNDEESASSISSNDDGNA
eukprot:9411364-Ditylum_brightwellii.AAC.1